MHAIITRQHKLTDHLQYDLTAETAQIINQNPLALRIKKIKICHFVWVHRICIFTESLTEVLSVSLFEKFAIFKSKFTSGRLIMKTSGLIELYLSLKR